MARTCHERLSRSERSFTIPFFAAALCCRSPAALRASKQSLAIASLQSGAKIIRTKARKACFPELLDRITFMARTCHDRISQSGIRSANPFLLSALATALTAAFRLSNAEGGTRTHAPLRTNGFQDRLVMTTSIPLHSSLRAAPLWCDLNILADPLCGVKRFFPNFRCHADTAPRAEDPPLS